MEKPQYKKGSRICGDCSRAYARENENKLRGQIGICSKCGEEKEYYRRRACQECTNKAHRKYSANRRGTVGECVKCGEVKPYVNGRTCKECHSAFMREYTKSLKGQIGICIGCNEEKIWHNGHRCEECTKAQRKEWAEANKEHVAEYGKEYRKVIKESQIVCSVCGKEAPGHVGKICKECYVPKHRQYYWDNREYYLEQDRQYRKNNPELMAERNRRYYENNKDKHAAYSKRYREEHLEERREYNRKYYHEHKDENREHRREYRQNNKEQINAGIRDWHRRNPEFKYQESARRRKQLENGEGLPKGWKQEQYNSQDGKCVGCEGEFSIEVFTLDHIIPLSKGGPHQPDNCQLLCGSCNSSKRDKDFEEWRAKRFAK